MDQVVDRLEIRRASRPAEAGVLGRDDLGVAAEQLQIARSRINRLRAVQEQERSTSAPAHDLELYTRDR